METAAKHIDRESEAFKKLQGVKKHFCPNWDYMAIDKTTDEFKACCCEQYNPPKLRAPTHCDLCGKEYGIADESCSNCGYEG